MYICLKCFLSYLQYLDQTNQYRELLNPTNLNIWHDFHINLPSIDRGVFKLEVTTDKWVDRLELKDECACKNIENI